MKKPPIFSRVLIKLSGEALMGPNKFGFHPKTINRICEEIQSVHNCGVEVCLVIGGGNIFRGISGSDINLERTSADYMGMLGTVINSLALQNILSQKNVPTEILSAIPMKPVCEQYSRAHAVEHLAKKNLIIFAAGTGNPFFTTDTAAALRAIEMNCQVILKGTLVDGVYDSDPKFNPKAIRYENLDYNQVLNENLGVMDTSAITLAKDHLIPIIVFSILKSGALLGALNGTGKFTTITN